MRLMRIPPEWHNHRITVALEKMGGLIMAAARTSTIARTAAAFGVALVTAGTTLAFTALYEPFAMKPVEMLGSFAYLHDLNINNRLDGLALFMLVSVLTFVAFDVFFFTMRER